MTLFPRPKGVTVSGEVCIPTFELGKREMMAMPLLGTREEEEEVDGRGGREEASVLSPSPFSDF